jgi:hypothetical protein
MGRKIRLNPTEGFDNDRDRDFPDNREFVRQFNLSEAYFLLGPGQYGQRALHPSRWSGGNRLEHGAIVEEQLDSDSSHH